MCASLSIHSCFWTSFCSCFALHCRAILNASISHCAVSLPPPLHSFYCQAIDETRAQEFSTSFRPQGHTAGKKCARGCSGAAPALLAMLLRGHPDKACLCRCVWVPRHLPTLARIVKWNVCSQSRAEKEGMGTTSTKGWFWWTTKGEAGSHHCR